MLRKFFAEKNGSAMGLIFVFATVIIVLSFAIPLVEQRMACAPMKSKSGVSVLFGTSSTKQACGGNEGVFDKGTENEKRNVKEKEKAAVQEGKKEEVVVEKGEKDKKASSMPQTGDKKTERVRQTEKERAQEGKTGKNQTVILPVIGNEAVEDGKRKNNQKEDASPFIEGNKGSILPPIGDGMIQEEGKEEVASGGGSESSESEKETVPNSYENNHNVQLFCQNDQSTSEFTIPDTPAGGMGTQNITISNTKNYPIYVNVSSAMGANGLRITSDHSYYRKVESGAKEVFAIGWQWNPSGAVAERGKGEVHFRLECAEPDDKAKLYTYPTERPTNFILANAEDGRLSLQWDEVPTTSEYLLYRGDTLIYRGMDVTYTDKGLMAGTTYAYKLYSMESLNRQVYAELKVKTTGTSPVPKAPSYLQLAASTPDSFYVYFGASAKATNYRIYIDGEEVEKTPYASYYGSKLKPNTTYKVSVLAENQYGQSEMIHKDVTTTGSSSVPNPAKFWLVSRTDSTLTVQWDSVPGATKYKVVSAKGIEYEGTGTSFTGTGIPPGGTRYYYLYTYIGDEVSNGTHGKFTALGQYPPQLPSDIKASVVTNTSIQLSWTKGSFAKTTVVTMDGNEIYNGEGAEFVATNLKPNTRYTFSFHSVGTGGTSGTTTYEVFTKNDVYGEDQEFEMSCTNASVTQSYTLPTTIKAKEGGVYSLHITNNSTGGMTLQLDNLSTSGSLFDENLIQLDYEATPLTVPKGQTVVYPIRWKAIALNDSDYTGKDGQLTVSLKGGC